MNIKTHLQNTDIYLIDLILKGKFDDFKTVLDVGCGSGRNITYFLQNNFNVFGFDPNEKRLEATKQLVSELNTSTPLSNFKIGTAEQMPFENKFDLIICNAVLHFAKNKTQFEEMLYKLWESLSSNGILFIRLASDIGIENLVEPIENGNYKLPDSTIRYLVNTQTILDYTEQLKGKLVEPIKTTNVQNLRCMTTWILRK